MLNRALIIFLVLCFISTSTPAAEDAPAWTRVHAEKKPMTADETRAFMKRLAKFVEDNHLKKNETSPQRGMVYEYLDMRRRGQFDQFVQGEALDTMHDGAWFGTALVSAYRATGDRYYYDLLTTHILPFYCKVLNHSDTLFANARDDAAKDAHRFNDKEHQLIQGEKGFCPYWWDDGNSISLERRLKKQPLGVFACTDNLAGKENPQYRLDGFSHGCSNHMAQDLGVLLMQSWLLLKDQKDDPAAAKLAADVAEAAKNLHASRMRRGYFIPAVAAPLAAMGDEAIRKRLPDPGSDKLYEPNNHYTRAMHSFKPGQRYSLPGFADDQEYLYYAGIARAGGQLPKPLAFKLIYDAYTLPLLYRAYSDDAPVPPGINVFDLHPYSFKDGKPEDYRSDRKGPHKKPRPVGSRFGPQNMVVSGWAIQALKANPGIWEQIRPQGPYHRGILFDNAHDDDGIVALGDGRFELTTRSPSTSRILLRGRGSVWLTLERQAMTLWGHAQGDEIAFNLYPHADAQETHAAITINRNGTVTAVNNSGKALSVITKVEDKQQRFSYSVKIPFTFRNGQAPWASVIEHQGYRIEAFGGKALFYAASDERQVQRALEKELSGGLRTWEAIFDEFGYIPSGIGTGNHFDHFSDSGGYAHLLKAAAMWLMYLEGKTDWQAHNIPPVAN